MFFVSLLIFVKEVKKWRIQMSLVRPVILLPTMQNVGFLTTVKAVVMESASMQSIRSYMSIFVNHVVIVLRRMK